MFNKLQKLFDSAPEREFKPRTQGLREKSPSAPAAKMEQKESPQYCTTEMGHKSDGKSTMIGEDPFNGKLEVGDYERIQSKIELVKQLQKELGKHG